MKKKIFVLSLFSILLFANCAFALSEAGKSKLATTRQIYNAKKDALNKQLDSLNAQYTTTLENTSMSTAAKEKKLNQLEAQIQQINDKKQVLLTQYKADKKRIKATYK